MQEGFLAGDQKKRHDGFEPLVAPVQHGSEDRDQYQPFPSGLISAWDRLCRAAASQREGSPS